MPATLALRLSCLVAACLATTACTRAPLTYDLSPDEAYARLEQADIAGFRMARQCGIMVYLSPVKSPGKSIGWSVTSSGQTVAHFTVRLEPSGDGTLAVIDIPRDPRGGEIYDGDKDYPRPAFNQPLRPALVELVDAAMDQRPYDVERLPQPRNRDRICDIQRGGLETGAFRFSVDDDVGKDSRQTALDRAAESADSFGAPMDQAQPQ